VTFILSWRDQNNLTLIGGLSLQGIFWVLCLPKLKDLFSSPSRELVNSSPVRFSYTFSQGILQFYTTFAKAMYSNSLCAMAFAFLPELAGIHSYITKLKFLTSSIFAFYYKGLVRFNNFISPPKCPDWLLGCFNQPPSGHLGLFPWIKRPRLWSWQLISVYCHV
jgi:hypothetical protein